MFLFFILETLTAKKKTLSASLTVTELANVNLQFFRKLFYASLVLLIDRFAET